MKTLLIACAGVLALTAAAAAQEAMALPPMDGNGDGSVTADELEAWVTSSFGAIDGNGDGYITEAESAGYIPADVYAATNANGDDGLSLDEFRARAQADFAAADADGDGTLN